MGDREGLSAARGVALAVVGAKHALAQLRNSLDRDAPVSVIAISEMSHPGATARQLGEVELQRAAPTLDAHRRQGEREEADRGGDHRQDEAERHKQRRRPNRVPAASWSLLRSLLFRGAVKRLDTP